MIDVARRFVYWYRRFFISNIFCFLFSKGGAQTFEGHTKILDSPHLVIFFGSFTDRVSEVYYCCYYDHYLSPQEKLIYFVSSIFASGHWRFGCIERCLLLAKVSLCNCTVFMKHFIVYNLLEIQIVAFGCFLPCMKMVKMTSVGCTIEANSFLPQAEIAKSALKV